MSTDPGVLSGVLEGHGDAVWGLAFNPTGDRLASCSADGTVRIWDPQREDGACLSTYDTQSGEPGGGGIPSALGTSPPPPCHPPCPPFPCRAWRPHLCHLFGHPTWPRCSGFPDRHRSALRCGGGSTCFGA